MTDKKAADTATDDTEAYGDAKATDASGMPLPSLLVLQTAGAIKSEKSPKFHGGFRRTWPKNEILKAAIAAAMSEHFAWNIRVVSAAMGKAPVGLWDRMVASSSAEESAPGEGPVIVTADSDDWQLELVDRKFLFLGVPNHILKALPYADESQVSLPIGMPAKEDFVRLLWAFGSEPGRAEMKATFAPDNFHTGLKMYQWAMAAYKNASSKATLNASMHIRRAWHRLDGRATYFVQDLMNIKEG